MPSGPCPFEPVAGGNLSCFVNAFRSLKLWVRDLRPFKNSLMFQGTLCSIGSRLREGPTAGNLHHRFFQVLGSDIASTELARQGFKPADGGLAPPRTMTVVL